MSIGQNTTIACIALSILIVPAVPSRSAAAQSPPARPQSATAPAHASHDSARMAGMADHAMSGPMNANMMKHMEMTPVRVASHADSVRATKIAAELKQAIAKYQDTAVAIADGYKMFLPNMKTQHVYHFTNNSRAILAAFSFNPSKPTSVLYKRGADGALHLVGAMYTMPKNSNLGRLNDRVPLSIARWHKHVNWCMPKKGEEARWAESKNGSSVFGPESPIATKSECDAVRGDFHESVFGWMVHANVYERDLGSIFGDDHSP